MKITFFGTSSMQPTRERGLFSLLIAANTENMLVDCGEGTQRQMKIARFNPNKLTRVFISHWHGDHVLGLAGLIQNLGANEYNKILHIYGPKGIKAYISNILNSCIFREKVEIKLHEIKPGIIFENDDMFVEAIQLYHSCICYGYSFNEKNKRRINLEYTKKFGLVKHPLLKELQNGKDIVWDGKKISVKKGTKLVKGKKVTIIVDTAFNKRLIEFAKDSDILICEATYLEEHKDKAMKYKHLTVKQAAEIAKKAKSKKLVLTHFSQRYKNDKVICSEAKKVFRNTVCSKDLDSFTI